MSVAEPHGLQVVMPIEHHLPRLQLSNSSTLTHTAAVTRTALASGQELARFAVTQLNTFSIGMATRCSGAARIGPPLRGMPARNGRTRSWKMLRRALVATPSIAVRGQRETLLTPRPDRSGGGGSA